MTGWMSLNVQVLGGSNYEIFDILIWWPGSAHDSRIFENSVIKLRFEQVIFNGFLLGDPGYSQTSYLFTLLLNPTSCLERRYNISYKTNRITIERLFKEMFPCLNSKFMNNIETIQIYTAACAVLHNIGRCDNLYNIHVENCDIETTINITGQPND